MCFVVCVVVRRCQMLLLNGVDAIGVAGLLLFVCCCLFVVVCCCLYVVVVCSVLMCVVCVVDVCCCRV